MSGFVETCFRTLKALTQCQSGDLVPFLLSTTPLPILFIKSIKSTKVFFFQKWQKAKLPVPGGIAPHWDLVISVRIMPATGPLRNGAARRMLKLRKLRRGDRPPLGRGEIGSNKGP